MPTLLKIDVSPRGDHSVSRQLTNAFAAEWQKTHNGTVVTRDLQKTDLPFVDLPWIAGAYSDPASHTPEQQKALAVSNELIAELLAADHIVIGTPMYNFTIPAILKAWIDHIVRVGVTFSAGPDGYKGLVPSKKTTVLVASGGDYGPGSPAESYDAESPYLKLIFGFIGITDVTIVKAGGTSAIDRGKTTLEAFLADQAPKAVSAAA